MKFRYLHIDLDGVLVGFGVGAVSLLNSYLKMVKDKTVWHPRDKDIRTTYKLGERVIARFGDQLVLSSYHDISNIFAFDKDIRRFGYHLIGLPENDGFWVNLDWMDNGQKLWEFVQPYNPIVLSSPLDSDDTCAIEKIKWCEVNLKLPPDRVIIKRDKWEHATTDGIPNILVDDGIHKLTPFIANGGIGVHHNYNVDETIEKLKLILE